MDFLSSWAFLNVINATMNYSKKKEPKKEEPKKDENSSNKPSD